MEFDLDQEDYMEFIQNLRDELWESTSHYIPVLMSQLTEFNWWLDVTLVVNHRNITIRIDRRNLYVIGYSRQGDDFFWEFRRESRQIPGSQFLRYSGNYGELTQIARRGREDCRLGYHSLQHAIYTLADTLHPNAYQVRSTRSLLVIIQIISEAVRFKHIAASIQQHWLQGVLLPLPIVEMQNSWSRLSMTVQRIDSGVDLHDVNDPRLITLDDIEAIANLGILLYLDELA